MRLFFYDVVVNVNYLICLYIQEAINDFVLVDQFLLEFYNLPVGLDNLNLQQEHLILQEESAILKILLVYYLNWKIYS